MEFSGSDSDPDEDQLDDETMKRILPKKLIKHKTVKK